MKNVRHKYPDLSNVLLFPAEKLQQYIHTAALYEAEVAPRTAVQPRGPSRREHFYSTIDDARLPSHMHKPPRGLRWSSACPRYVVPSPSVLSLPLCATCAVSAGSALPAVPPPPPFQVFRAICDVPLLTRVAR